MLSAPGSCAPVVGPTGLGGMGKSALAVHATRLMSDQFDGGQVYADLGASRDIPADPAKVHHGLVKTYARHQAQLKDGPELCRAVLGSLAASRVQIARESDSAGPGVLVRRERTAC